MITPKQPLTDMQKRVTLRAQPVAPGHGQASSSSRSKGQPIVCGRASPTPAIPPPAPPPEAPNSLVSPAPANKRGPHSADLRKARFSNTLGMYYITKCLKRPGELTTLQCDEICEAFQYYRGTGAWYLHAFVVMPDHWHALFNLGQVYSLSVLLNQLARRASYPSRARSETIPWQSEFHDHKVRSGESAIGIVRYIHDNPVRKGLAQFPEDWPWCSAHPQFAQKLDRHVCGHERWEE